MRLIFSVLFGLALVFSAQAQTKLVVTTDKQVTASDETQFHYIFENEKFTTTKLELIFDGTGKGEFKFKKKESDEMVNPLQVTAAVLEQINALLAEVNYFDSNENYQFKKDFSHLGTVTIDCGKNGKSRKVSFNYTENPAMNKLANIFRNIATQETRVFEIETIRQNDPISTPAQLRYLESELRSKNIADPARFTALLKDIKGDEGVPLIARNHADRLLKEIQKTK